MPIRWMNRDINITTQLVFWGFHAACLGVLWVGVSACALAGCIFLYFVRMFAITAGYHRYFSHRTYETSRLFQFILAFLGATSAQKGPIWWASLHRHHHRHSDTEQDIHPPSEGFWWAHVGWVLSTRYLGTKSELVRDLRVFPELCWLDRWYMLPPLVLGSVVYGCGLLLERYAPGYGTNGLQMLVWGFFVSTMLLAHGTFSINSLTHTWGSRRFKTPDRSRNNFLLALITLGEGWHNNHHRYPGSERQGFYWWELDISHLILVCLSKLGLVWNLRAPPARIYAEARAGGIDYSSKLD